MRLLYTPSHPSIKRRFLVHSITIQTGERYLGVVARLYDKCWVNNLHAGKYRNRGEAARGLLVAIT